MRMRRGRCSTTLAMAGGGLQARWNENEQERTRIWNENEEE